MAINVVLGAGSFTGTGQSQSFPVYGYFNFSMWGTPQNADGTSGSFTGSVAVERSLDGGQTFIPVATDGTGTAAVYSAPVSVVGEETEPNALYRFNCTSYSGGTINCQISQSRVGINREVL
jgi:hypothetical protein